MKGKQSFSSQHNFLRENEVLLHYVLFQKFLFDVITKERSRG